MESRAVASLAPLAILPGMAACNEIATSTRTATERKPTATPAKGAPVPTATVEPIQGPGATAGRTLAGVEPLPLTEGLITQPEAYTVETMERLEVPGAAVALVQGGEMVYARGFGVCEVGRDDPVTPRTLMMIGSTTTSLTTMVMATLVDEGAMDWDTPIGGVCRTQARAVHQPALRHQRHCAGRLDRSRAGHLPAWHAGRRPDKPYPEVLSGHDD